MRAAVRDRLLFAVLFALAALLAAEADEIAAADVERDRVDAPREADDRRALIAALLE